MQAGNRFTGARQGRLQRAIERTVNPVHRRTQALDLRRQRGLNVAELFVQTRRQFLFDEPPQEVVGVNVEVRQ